MKSFIATIAGLSLLTATIAVLNLLTMPVTMPVGNVVLAASTSTVAATVMVQNISVSVADGAIAYGVLGQNATSTVTLIDVQTATNNGNVAETFNIKGINSSDWTIGPTAATNVYVHKFCTSTCATPPTNYDTALTLSYATLKTNVAVNGTTTIDLMINTPNLSTVFAQQSVDVTVQAVAF